jgi:hypothetical protein
MAAIVMGRSKMTRSRFRVSSQYSIERVVLTGGLVDCSVVAEEGVGELPQRTRLSEGEKSAKMSLHQARGAVKNGKEK